MPRKATKWALEKRKAGIEQAKLAGKYKARTTRKKLLTDSEADELRADMQAAADKLRASEPWGWRDDWWSEKWKKIAAKYGIRNHATLVRYLGRTLTSYGRQAHHKYYYDPPIYGNRSRIKYSLNWWKPEKGGLRHKVNGVFLHVKEIGAFEVGLAIIEYNKRQGLSRRHAQILGYID